MMTSLLNPLIKELIKIKCSTCENKDYKYKRALFEAFKTKGGVYIKFLQVLSNMHDFMQGWSGPKDLEVFNKVELEPLDIYKYINKDNFDYVETTPFASGSFAQLYRGMIDKKIVAIKVLRPRISENLRNDLLDLRQVIRIVQYFLPKSVIDYKGAFEEFSRNCLLEADYNREISNMEYFQRLYQDSKYVKIPFVYKEYSNDKVIVQEYIEGPTLADIMEKSKVGKSLQEIAFEETGSNIWTQIMILGGEALKTAIISDYVYGDPHPGNVILLPNDKIALIDFGIVANKPLSQEAFYLWTKSYYDVLMGSVDYNKLLETTYMCFCPDLLNAYKKLSLKKDFLSYVTEAVNDKAMNNMENNKMKNLFQNGHLVKAFSSFVDSKNALNIRLDLRNFQLLKSMQIFLSSVTTIDNNDGNNSFAKLMIGSMKYALYYVEKVGVKKDYNYSSKYTINESYEILLDTLSSLAEGDEFLFDDILERMNV